MKSWLWKGMLAAAITLPMLNDPVRAQSNDDFGCSNATLKGEYAFGVTDLTLQQVVARIKVFDGNGNFTQRDYIGDRVPAEFAPPGQETGTYIVNRGCTGSMVIDLNVPVFPVGARGVIKILFVISNGGRHIHEVVSEFVPPGSTTRQPTQTSADDWKVASERDD